MSISIVNVVVPVSGDGPIASISDLVGEKTVELSGRFVGRYILLGSQNGVNFVPVAVFDSNGKESIEVTLALALISVRVRSEALNPSNVTMNVSGVLSAGNNKFATIATIAPGSSGVQQPIIDLNIALPPGGVEQDICFLCQGGFQGQVTIEGSLDGFNFNPIGKGFRADAQPTPLLGALLPLEFSPLTTTDLVRYIRVTLNGTVTSTVTVTIGGSIPAATGGVTQNIGVVTSTDTIYALQAKGSTTVPFTDDIGNVISMSFAPFPADVVCIGQRNNVTYTSAPVVVIGSDIVSLLNDSVVVGQQLSVGCFGSNDVIIGKAIQITDLNSSHTDDIIIGARIMLEGRGSARNILIGREIQVSLPGGDGSFYNIGIGDGVHIGDNAWGNTIITGESGNNYNLFNSQWNCGYGSNRMGANVNLCHTIGSFNAIEAGSAYCTIIGSSNTIKGLSFHVHMIGYGLYAGNINAPFPSNILFLAGTDLTCTTLDAVQPNHIVLIGNNSAVFGPNTDDTVVIGSNNSIQGVANSVILGKNITLHNAGTSSCVIIGDDIQFPLQSFGLSVAIGGAIQVRGEGVVIGYGAKLGSSGVGTITYGVAIGAASTAASTNVLNTSIALGLNATSSDSQCVIGKSDTTNSPNPSIRHFVVRGLVGPIGGPGVHVIDTISAISEPATDFTGLTVTYNDGATISNKAIQVISVDGLGTLPVGTKVLYIV